ncbi:MAG: gamma-glutamylcyclotransferase, partial [Lysobacterales bacterium]
MNKLDYFAYGSNMSSKRLRARLPSASLAGVGVLRGHRLVFHKVSNHDGSGKCGIVESTRDHVLGVLYEIDADEKPVLDRIEGAGYVEKRIEISLPSGNSRL